MFTFGRPRAESPQMPPEPQRSVPTAYGELVPCGVASSQGFSPRPSPKLASESYFMRTSRTQSPLAPNAPSSLQRYGNVRLAPLLSFSTPLAVLTFPYGGCLVRPA